MTDRTITAGAPITRRRVLQSGALVGFGAFLAACSGGGGATAAPSSASSASPSAGGSSPSPAPSESGSATIEGPLNFANWPAYIDLNEDETKQPTIEDFKAKYGIDVSYVEDIQTNEDFFATIAPQLQAGLDTGWDLIVLTDYMAARLVTAGWVEPIDAANVPTAMANVREELRGILWDPEMQFHFPWQSGATGIGYNVKSTGKDLTKVADLFLPEFKGKVTLLSGYQDTFALVSLLLKTQGAITNTPDKLTVDDGQKLHDYLKPFVDDGHIRKFTGNEYLQDFASGDTWLAEVWSGDLASSGGEDDRFQYPEEGSIIWTDNMLIPKGAVHKRAAEAMIDWVYEVPNAARLAKAIYYISPVKGVSEEIKKSDPELAANPLLFPGPEVTSKQYPQPALEGDADQQMNDLFSDIEGS